MPPAFVYTLLGSVGVAQLFGIGMVTAGALVPSRPVRERLATVRIVPLVSPNTVGLTVSGAL